MPDHTQPLFPVIQTPRLNLRELVKDDAPAIFAIHSDTDAMHKEIEYQKLLAGSCELFNLDKKGKHLPKQVGGCFIAGTLVHTDQGLKPIEKIRIGDRVLSQPEGGGERVCKQVVNTFTYDDKEIWVVKYTLASEAHLKRDKPLHHLYTTANPPFWVDGEGWTAADELSADQQLQLVDGGIAIVQQVWPVWRTPVAGMGWVRTDILGIPDNESEAHIVDFRTSCDLWAYPLRRERDAAVPYSYPGDFDCTIFDHKAMLSIIYDEGDRAFKSRVYNLEVEDCHTYYVGEEGVWVRNRMTKS
ncbi:polymorphic toxin-type HINT domain-containing protein [Iodobacter sp. LRB]|uniref:polymorphic toxin-type HINT domain-containing protein n=1 Tax=unclassified Iodobacter TaxID=235634 RepID=UPI0015D4B93F|nr:polymorphic toxin-type HINT domain-containing protein [Iodobacter sp. BJB302]